MLGLCCRNTAQSFPPSKPSIPPVYEAVKTQINQFLEVQVIRESSSPYTSPIVVVQKKDVSLCMCVDYRLLNSKTRKDAFPLLLFEESLDVLLNFRPDLLFVLLLGSLNGTGFHSGCLALLVALLGACDVSTFQRLM